MREMYHRCRQNYVIGICSILSVAKSCNSVRESDRYIVDDSLS
ncbi:hypothetical protein [uncultured Eubacterium sp.]|nr:hypothetical protein [uncultured Eubacterium sp.]